MAENKGCQTFFCRRTSKRNLTVYIYNQFFLYLNKKVNLKRLANSEDELYNVAAVLRIQKLYVAMFYLFANICPFYISISYAHRSFRNHGAKYRIRPFLVIRHHTQCHTR